MAIHNITCTDLTIPTGGTLTANTSTITCSGDFTTSGGLIGKSCYFHAGTGAVNQDTGAFVTGATKANRGTNAFTMECWFKSNAADGEHTLFHNGDGSLNTGVWIAIRSGQVEFDMQGVTDGDGSTTIHGSGTVWDGKWHHIACVRNGASKKVYVDGRLELDETIGTQSVSGEAAEIRIGSTHDNNYTLSGCVDEWRLWNDERTATEIRANMFSEIGSPGSDLIAYYKFNEGATAVVADSCNTGSFTARNLAVEDAGSASSSLWAGAGTFTKGTSTLTLTGSSKNLTFSSGLHNLTINGTYTFDHLTSDGAALALSGALVLGGSGTLTSADDQELEMETAGQTITLTNLTGLSALSKLRFTHNSGSTNLPACTTPRVFKDGSGGTVVATGDLTITTELSVASGTTFNANGNTIAVKTVDVNSGTLNLSNSTLIFNVTNAGDDFDLNETSTLTTGNTTITGHSAATKTPWGCPAAGGYEVVGDVKWLHMQSDADLTVIGAVIACDLADSTANIRQWHHTLDTQQLLDADSAGDDDLKLERPALDNALELMTG